MKHVGRYGVFETASSAVHSLTFKKEAREKSNLKISNDGKIHVVLDQHYGMDREDFFGQYDKLKYILTCMYCCKGCPDLSNEFERFEFLDDWIIREFADEFKKYTGAEFVVHPHLGQEGYRSSYDYFNHQIDMNDFWSGGCVVDLNDADQVMDFIFNPDVGLHCDCD